MSFNLRLQHDVEECLRNAKNKNQKQYLSGQNRPLKQFGGF